MVVKAALDEALKTPIADVPRPSQVCLGGGGVCVCVGGCLLQITLLLPALGPVPPYFLAQGH